MNQKNITKILHIITGLSTGGAETMLYKLLSRMDRSVFSNQVVSLTTKGPVAVKIEALGIKVQAMGMRRGVPDPRAIWKLRRLIREIKPDVIQTWMYHADLLGGLAARMAGKAPVVWNIRHSNLDPKDNKKTTLWTAKVCALLSRRIPRRIVCCSEASRKVHEAIGYDQDKLLVIPNGFDLEMFQPRRGADERCWDAGIKDNAGMLECWNAGIKDNDGMLGLGYLGIGGLRDLEIGGLRNSGIEGLRNSGIEEMLAPVKSASPAFGIARGENAGKQAGAINGGKDCPTVKQSNCLIGMVARFDPQKDHRNLVQAAEILKDRGIDCCFVLCGNGVDAKNDQLTGWIRDAGVEDRFFLLGPRDDIPMITSGLDIACLSSHGEGFPNVLGEAMACEVPCVATDVGDSADIVGDTGRVVPPRNPEALAGAIGELVDMGQEGRKQLGRAARERIKEKFELGRVVRRYEKLYQGLI